MSVVVATANTLSSPLRGDAIKLCHIEREKTRKCQTFVLKSAINQKGVGWSKERDGE